MLCCELCGEATECLQKKVDGKDLVVCTQCWCPVEEIPGVRQPVEVAVDNSLEEDFEETLI